ncbi:ATP-binding protein [Micromonospora sp. MS34]|uniref:ATP-binding protein n=1 Tax=Micromonospora sp. MS34 TaxID=3385971 RepID=UPI00399F3288
MAVDVVDDGVGFDPGSSPAGAPGGGGFGLAAMRARVQALGGTLEVRSAAGRGTAVSARLPVAFRAAGGSR